MSSAAPVQTVAAKPQQAAGANLVLQPKCACGAGASGLTGECAECGRKLQTKFRIGAPDDAYEQEADRIAEQVLARSAHPEFSSAPPRIQRFTGQAGAQADRAPASVDQVLAGPGRPLDPALRQDMEQRFGHDFSLVRVHSDAIAERSAREVKADAYTVGQNIVFGAGRFEPGTHAGRRLIAHELTHVVQQSGPQGIRGTVQRSVLGSIGGTLFGAAFGAIAGTIFGPVGTVVGGILGGLAGLIVGGAESADTRKLTPEERAEARRVFGPSLNYDRVQVAVSRVTTFPSHARTPWETVYLPPDTIPAPDEWSDDLIAGTYFGILMHELCHVWQTQHGIGVTHKFFSSIFGSYGYGGRKGLRAAWAKGKHFLDFGLEQQGAICEDYYLRLRDGKDTSAYRPYIMELQEGGRRLAPGFIPSSEPGDFPTPSKEEPIAELQAKLRIGESGTPAQGSPEVSPVVNEVVHSPGQPLDAATRSFMESRFGHDFGAVRVHTDAAAAASSQELGARAYTVGRHIAFGAGEYAPASRDGRLLLAHELAHAVQQRDRSAAAQPVRSVSRPGEAAEREADAAAESVLAGHDVALTARPPAGQALRDTKEYETAGIPLDTAAMTDWAGRSFWEQKVFAVLAVTTVVPANTRLSAPEERDAVFSVLFDIHQSLKPVKSETLRTVTIPARGSKAPALSYTFIFRPPVDKKKDKRDRVEVRFEAEGAGATPVAAPAAAAGAKRPPSFTVSSFPTADKKANNHAAWFKRFPDEQAQLFTFIASATLPAGGQIVTTSSAVGKKLHESTFTVTPGTSGPNIKFVAESTPASASPPAGFAGHDYGDLALEKPGKDKAVLGKLTLPVGMPADEIIPVKYTVWQYFQGGTRNAEVDAIIPIPGTKPKRVFYTIKFHGKTNDVDVLRIGEEGKAGTVALAKITFDIARIPDYAAHAKDVTTLSAWLKTRYRKITPTGKDVPAMKAAAEAEIAAGAVKKDWFKDIYGMEELDAAGAKARLRTVQLWDEPQVVNTKPFTADERKLLERAFETLGDKFLALLKGVPLARQQVFINKGGTAKAPTYTPEPKTSGTTATLTTTSGTTTTVDRTVVLFDNWFTNDAPLFTGGTGGIAPASLKTPLHEFGHVVGAQAGIKDAFEKKFTASKAALKTAPITWYAKSDPPKEFFAEAFALFHADPEWMQANLPGMYAWFQTLSNTGKPPP